MNGLITFLAVCCATVSATGCYSSQGYSNVPSCGQEVIFGSSYSNCPDGIQTGSVCSGCPTSTVEVAPAYSTSSVYQSAPVYSSAPIVESYGQGALLGSSYSNCPVGIQTGSYATAVEVAPTSVGSVYESALPTIQSAPLLAQPRYVEQPIYTGPSYLGGSIDCGPQPRPEPIKYLPTQVLPVKEGQIQVLPSGPLPRPVVIANKCVCTKVVQKPQLYQRLIVQQKNQRFLKKTYVPRTEKVEYCAKPRC